MFDIGRVGAQTRAVPLNAATRAVEARDAVRDALKDSVRETVPVLPALRPIVPGGGLRPGSAVELAGQGSGSLGLALLAGVSRHGGWCAAVGLPELGVLSAAGMGVEPERLLLVDDPAGRWPDVSAALLEAVDLVLLRPPDRPAAAVVRRLNALARKHGSVLAVNGQPWEGARLRLEVSESHWTGLGDGHGHLRGRQARVTAHGRGAATQGRDAWIWLPGHDGTVSTAELHRPTLPRPSLEVVA
jgi:hypothetical protein